MIVRDRSRGKMPCESCAVQFSVFKRKRVCSECERCYCSGCLRRGGGTMCAPCRVLSTRPLSRLTISHLKVRDLQCFLQRQNVSTRGCVEKEELVSLCVSHVNSASYRRRGSRNGPFSGLKGLTTNINDFLNSAFDIRSTPQPAPPPSRSCYNSTHAHQPPSNPGTADPPPTQFRPERFTTTPGGERDIVVEVPAARVPRSASSGSARVDTADCFEVEDLDDAGWEFLATPADPLPNDSEVLILTPDGIASPPRDEREGRPSTPPVRAPTPPRRPLAPPDQAPTPPRRPPTGLGPPLASPARAASELDLRRSDSGATNTDTASLQDEPLMDHEDTKPISLGQLQHASELEALSVKQLKELLARNRVEFRGCLERADLLQRARMLWQDHNHYKDELDKLPIEECCKICMAAPLECVLLECGHMAACTACSKQLAECPICRQYVVRAVRVFRS